MISHVSCQLAVLQGRQRAVSGHNGANDVYKDLNAFEFSISVAQHCLCRAMGRPLMAGSVRRPDSGAVCCWFKPVFKLNSFELEFETDSQQPPVRGCCVPTWHGTGSTVVPQQPLPDVPKGSTTLLTASCATVRRCSTGPSVAAASCCHSRQLESETVLTVILRCVLHGRVETRTPFDRTKFSEVQPAALGTAAPREFEMRFKSSTMPDSTLPVRPLQVLLHSAAASQPCCQPVCSPSEGGHRAVN